MTDDDTALRELLHRAAPDMGSLVPPADLAPARQPRPAKLIAVSAVIAAVAGLAVLIGLLRQSGPNERHAIASGPTPRPSTESSPPSSGHYPLTVEIELDQTTVQAGQRISGAAVVTNSSGHPLVIVTCLHIWLQVGLTNANVSLRPMWLLCRDAHGTSIPVGTTRNPITVGTTYSSCTDGAATPDTPKCLHVGRKLSPPPLPPGKYMTNAAMLTPQGVRVPAPEPIQVTLTP